MEESASEVMEVYLSLVVAGVVVAGVVEAGVV